MTIRNSTALCAALALPDGETPPEWIKILPAGRIDTVDGRGPYRASDLQSIIANSLQAAGGKLVVDENHSTDLAAPRGEAAPARGWIVELAARADGIHGRVEWTEAGRALLADRAYRGLSPVIVHDKQGEVLSVLRVSLTNVPNLRGMTALHAVGATMEELMKRLRDALGLGPDVDEAAILAKIKSLSGVAAQASEALKPIALAAGLKEDADASVVLNAVTTLAKADASGDQVKALQSELAGVTTALNALRAERATDKATAFVDDAIKAGRVGVKPLREHYIARHAADPASVEKEINALPILTGAAASALPPTKGGAPSLQAEQAQAAKLLGLSVETFSKTLQAEAAEREVA